ncbi:MAG: fibro-slime domain-containing protein [Polyangiales bacterium]
MQGWVATLLSGLMVGCMSVPERDQSEESASSDGNKKGTTHGSVTPGAPATPCALEVRVRDFGAVHPDFEGIVNERVVTGLVESTLGPDRKPRGVPALAAPVGINAFDDWYNDRQGVNQPLTLSLSLDETSPGVFVFDSDAFFPVDKQALGNEGRAHNYHFTSEIHTRFRYDGGEKFTFAGDDDVWVFINGKLAIDLGGVHVRASTTVDLDARAAELGIARGNLYTMDIFHAERHTVESTFRIETTIDCFTTVI